MPVKASVPPLLVMISSLLICGCAGLGSYGDERAYATCDSVMVTGSRIPRELCLSDVQRKKLRDGAEAMIKTGQGQVLVVH